MLRRLIALTALAAGMTIAAAIALATPALAKGPSQARVTGPGLTHAIVVSGNGEPGQQGELSTLAVQTGLFFVLFGPNAGAPPQLRTPPPKGSLGPQYTIIYTVPGGITSHPDEQFGQIRQDLYPRAVGGPLVYTPPSQHAGPFPVFGWLRASHGLPRTLARLGIPSSAGTRAASRAHLAPAAHPVAEQQAGPRPLPWLIASAAAIAAAALACTVLVWRHRKPAATNDSQPTTAGPAAG
ncbi:MAG TPA: hypothetical protein VFJ07_13330 [Streptosporangiaceae bacterium]|nr:hypothetical protein [Streptosporangiaceae bacterium]